MSKRKYFKKKIEGRVILLPRLCECGGELEYQFEFGRIFNYCKKCTPVQYISMKDLRSIGVV